MSHFWKGSVGTKIDTRLYDNKKCRHIAMTSATPMSPLRHSYGDLPGDARTVSRLMLSPQACVFQNRDLVQLIYEFNPTYRDMYRNCANMVAKEAVRRCKLRVAHQLVDKYVMNQEHMYGYVLDERNKVSDRSMETYPFFDIECTWQDDLEMDWARMTSGHGQYIPQLSFECRLLHIHTGTLEFFYTMFYDVEYCPMQQSMICDLFTYNRIPNDTRSYPYYLYDDDDDI